MTRVQTTGITIHESDSCLYGRLRSTGGDSYRRKIVSFPDFKLSYYRSRLFTAIENGSVAEVTSFLQVADQDLIQFQLVAALFKAISLDNVEIVEVLVDFGLDINEVFADSNALTCVLDFQTINVLKWLLSRGVDVNIKLPDSLNTPLHVAVSNHKQNKEQEMCLKELLRVPGLKKEELNKDGLTPLMLAARRGACKCMDILLNFGCDIAKKNSVNYDARYYCCDTTYHKNPHVEAECFRTLIRHGCHLNDYPILLKTIDSNNMLILSLIVSANVDFDNLLGSQVSYAQEDRKLHPLNYAFAKHRDRAVAMLISAGCDVRKVSQEICELHRVNPEICSLNWVIQPHRFRPRTLKDLTRITIRRSLGLFPQKQITALSLPPILQDYILGKDFLKLFL